MPTDKDNRLKKKAEKLPRKPGIYFFKSREDTTLYIGKARSLKNRVKSYFAPTSDIRIKNLLSETEDIDFILTDSEREASFLENNFVREHQPKYNLRLKDDKSFPYLKITTQERFPGIYLTRNVKPDSSRYFGPFSPAAEARNTIYLVAKHFGIRTCLEKIPGRRKRPCLEYDLKQCSAPCVRFISGEYYSESAENALLFLEGKVEKLMRIAKQKMQGEAENQRFEQAALWRDLISTLEQIKEKPRLISLAKENSDIFGYARKDKNAALYVLLMRKGRVIESEGLLIRKKQKTSDEDILSEQLMDFYKGRKDLPEKILLPFPPSNKDEIRAAITTATGKRALFHIPFHGKSKKLVELAVRNAETLLKEKGQEQHPFFEVQELFGLDTLPSRIEGFDISNTGGDESVGSLVVFENGEPLRQDYRKYRIRTVRGPDDVASLREVIRRRYKRLLEEKRLLPDLILVDGGRGQLNAARKALIEVGLGGIPVLSLAKKEEIVFSPIQRQGTRLERSSPTLKLLQRIRDEAHRSAITYHRKRREKRSFASVLDDIPGIGKKRKASLLEKYRGIDTIKKALPKELEKIVGKKAARELFEKVKSKK